VQSKGTVDHPPIDTVIGEGVSALRAGFSIGYLKSIK
jgi:hypothetical protein